LIRRFARLALWTGGASWAELARDEAILLSGPPWDEASAPTGDRVGRVDAQGRSARTRPLAPVAPRTIFGVGRNYRAHARELGNDVPVEPMIFYKPVSSILDPGGTVELPPASISERVEHEVELGVVVGKPLRRASAREARDAIFGVTLVADITARDLQKRDGQWWRAKGMDGFCPVGPVLVTGLDPQALSIVGTVNGEVRQSGRTSDMIFSVADVLAHVSASVSIAAGDLVATGTPEGVGPLRAGDRLEIHVAEIGTLSVSIGMPPIGARRAG
jgi:2-keto-4-pentenoate hydratase/2-oxohepta-3-ene-1,7-dioic acid hydratase in catechol pathway